jgi:periplasmic divalent cation tolerance protein
MTDARVVLTTAGSHEEAHNLANALVQRRLAACVNIVPRIESIYRWEGNVDTAEEWLLLVKTTELRFPEVRDAIRELHSYEVPECIAVMITDGSPEYLRWLTENAR